MHCLRKKEIETLINYIEDENIKNILLSLKDEFDEVPVEILFEKIKDIDNIASIDYKIFLLLEEFYLRIKNIEDKNHG